MSCGKEKAGMGAWIDSRTTMWCFDRPAGKVLGPREGGGEVAILVVVVVTVNLWKESSVPVLVPTLKIDFPPEEGRLVKRNLSMYRYQGNANDV
jgi:hypothetical protein